MTQFVHITLGKSRPAIPDDPMGRSWIGYDPRKSVADNWAVNRGAWRLDPKRVEQCELAIFSNQGRVAFVAEISGLERVPDAGHYKGRWMLLGTPLEGHPLQGGPQPVPRSFGNPVAFGSLDA